MKAGEPGVEGTRCLPTCTPEAWEYGHDCLPQQHLGLGLCARYCRAPPAPTADDSNLEEAWKHV